MGGAGVVAGEEGCDAEEDGEDEFEEDEEGFDLEGASEVDVCGVSFGDAFFFGGHEAGGEDVSTTIQR